MAIAEALFAHEARVPIAKRRGAKKTLIRCLRMHRDRGGLYVRTGPFRCSKRYLHEMIDATCIGSSVVVFFQD